MFMSLEVRKHHSKLASRTLNYILQSFCWPQATRSTEAAATYDMQHGKIQQLSMTLKFFLLSVFCVVLLVSKAYVFKYNTNEYISHFLNTVLLPGKKSWIVFVYDYIILITINTYTSNFYWWREWIIASNRSFRSWTKTNYLLFHFKSLF